MRYIRKLDSVRRGLVIFLQDADVVGTCAFTAPPREDKVEIAYFTFPQFEGYGIATTMARELIAIARSAVPAVTLTANTLPERNASNSILEKLGFKSFATIDHPEDGKIWEWHRTELIGLL